MRRNVIFTGLALVVPAFAVFAWKVFGLGLPVVPSEPEGLWRVEIELRLRSLGTRGSVKVALPSSQAGQLVDDEQVTTDRLRFAVQSERGERTGVWKGAFAGVHQPSHSFRVQLRPVVTRLPSGRQAAPPTAIEDAYAGSTAVLPSSDPEVGAFLLRLALRGPEDAVGRARTLLTFVADEVELVPDGSDDALLCLGARECGALGKERLLATLLRGVGTPARIVQGLKLHREAEPSPTAWVEAWFDGWLPISASNDFFGSKPRNLLALTTREGPPVRSIGMEAVTYHYRAQPEPLRADEMAALMVPANSLFSEFSLYRLPLATQRILRILLVIPLGALLLALVRNVVGVPTFGTFLPVLLALALRESALLTGFGMLIGVLVLGWLGRLLMDRLHLLLVPRLCIVLCLVVLAATGLAILGRGLEQRDLLSGVIFPMVILTMLIERFSISVAEEGGRTSLIRLGWSVGVTACVYPLFQSDGLSLLMLGHPELVLAVMGSLVWIGGYTGYRISELVRFRSLIASGVGGAGVGGAGGTG